MEYKKGNIVIDKDTFEQEIKEEEFIIKIIMNMIHINPKKRKSIDEYLRMFVSESMDKNSTSFPESFHKTFYPLGCSFMLPEFLKADEKICLIYHSISKQLPLMSFRE